ncbi:hypothetical protein HanXRQr2_Chr10g0464011 [Helianthus annuus]|uniref:Uncharacterized protein n=1 Tax=Helianthus annuus TaxID=4232 RepID=A0A251TPX7_HELAN|nr:hypothetical protein HanXRQr2_Chr10g0464011 [Helianthus annuus]KAJ0885678.1 hypothetical protein HanPSC8_Chr10g0447811 [Helianthus annuus]KAJ0916495.1 hypothetical protein HanPSC8_Chr06g0262321 [Helianthus annuus]
MQLVCQYEVRLQRYIAMIDMRIDASLKQSYAFYAAFDGIPGLQASGAYIFSIQMVNILLALRSRFVTIELSGILK